MPDYPNLRQYIWNYNKYYEVYVESYMKNQKLQAVYLGFKYNNNNIIAKYI